MKKIIRIAVPIVIFYFIFKTILSDWQTTVSYLSSINLVYLVLAFLFMLLVYPQGAFAWYKIIRNFNQKATIESSIPIWIISNTSRYIPGTIWQYLGRMELAVKQMGVSRSQVGLSMIYEVFLNLASASILSILIIVYNDAFPDWLILPGIAAVVLFLQPKLVGYLIDLLVKLLKRKFTNIHVEHNFSAVYKALPWFLLNFFLNGVALTILSLAVGISINFNTVIAFTAYYAFSWMIGFLTIIAPGGLGVMEGSLTLLLSATMPISQAGVIAILYRFFLSLSEICVFSVSLFIYGRKQKILGK